MPALWWHRTLSTFTLALAMVMVTTLHAQDAPASLSEELCSCVTAIPVDASDAMVRAGFRTCLEDIVIHHPGEVRAMLKGSPPAEGKGYVIGRTLKGILDRDCPASWMVKERLRKIALTPDT